MESLKKNLWSLIPILALAGATPSQKMLSYLPAGGPSRFTEECVPSPACGAPGVREFHAFTAPARPPGGVWSGAVCLDDRSGVVYATNGADFITRRRYPNLGCGGSGGALPSLPIPTAIGTVTGMAIDPTSEHLFLTNGTTIFEVDPTAGMAILASWSASPLNILTGLDFDVDDPLVLTAVSTAGEVAEYAMGGGLLSVTPAPYAWPGADAVGVAKDRTDGSTCHVFVLHRNGDLYDHSAGVLVRSRTANRVGLTFLPAPLRLQSGASCGGVAPDPHVNSFPIAGSSGFVAELCNIPPSSTVALLLVGFPATSAPIAHPAGDLWVGAAPIAVGVPTGGAASVGIPLPIAGLSVPFGFDVQWAIDCAAAPSGFIFADGLQIEISR